MKNIILGIVWSSKFRKLIFQACLYRADRAVIFTIAQFSSK